MNVLQSLDLSLYIKTLKYNNKSMEEIDKLKKEYIAYTNGVILEPFSEELKWYLNYLEEIRNVKKEK